MAILKCPECEKEIPQESGLIKQLEYEGFSREEAEYGVTGAGY